jgi:phage virion morphogenesis (putative tail completion) protein
MAGTSMTMDMSALSNMVDGMISRLKNRQALMETIGETLVSSTLERFDNEEDPQGDKWQATKRGGAILQDSGGLKGSIVYEAGLDQVVVGTNKVYGAIHQFGGDTGRYHGVTLPARPYLGISEEDRKEIKHMCELYMIKGLGG